MSEYAPPIRDMRFVLEEIAGLGRRPGLDREADDPQLVAAALDAAGALAREVIAPLNRPGDLQGSRLENGVVRTPDGFVEAYRRFVEGGWNALPFPAEHGGQGMSWTAGCAVQEMWQSANLSFGLCPLLSQGAVELIMAHASAEQRRRYLPHLVSGRWTGSMNLTEPQAGSDLGQIRARAVRVDGGYRLTGQKIFITYGDHDLAENIVHLVLARAPNAPAGSKGISLFIAPKFRVGPDGALGARNDLRCVTLEHKLGVKASPTAVMSYGDDGGAWAELVGEEHRGLEYMFTMMNNARLHVGLQGVAIAERATQRAIAYARGRVQGREMGGALGAPVPIIRHPDVRRMVLTMRAGCQAARALTYRSFAALDLAKKHPDAAARARHQAELDLLTPVVKAWCTDLGVEIASLGVQVHGGMGFIEETGAAQHWRDARITPIYEGTNGIQAMDLVFRKLARDQGEAAETWFTEIAESARHAAESRHPDLAVVGRRLNEGLAALRETTRHMLAAVRENPRLAAAGATSYLEQFGLVAGGHVMNVSAMAAAARAAGDAEDRGFFAAKIATARFYAETMVSEAPSRTRAVIEASPSVLAFEEAWL